MAQDDLIVVNAGGATVRAKINTALAALGSGMKGPNAPPAPLAGMVWVEDDTPSASVWTVRMYDGADWIALGQLDSTNNRFTPSGIFAAGSAAAPGFAPAGDTNTGLWAPAADTLALSTNGTERLRIADALATLAVPLELPAADPASANRAARKAYVDAGDVLVKIADAAITAVGQIDVEWTEGAYRSVTASIQSYLPSGYDPNINLALRARVGGSYLAGGSDYAQQIVSAEASVVGGAAITGTSLLLENGGHNTANDVAFATLELDPGPGGAGGEASVLAISKHSRNGGGRRGDTVYGSIQATSPVSGLRFLWTGGANFAAVGRVVVTGVRA